MLFKSKENITAYCSSDDLIVINYNFEPFYFFENVNKDIVYFNLPSSNVLCNDFYTENNIKCLDNHYLEFDNIQLPKKEKNFVVKNNYTFTLGKNPNKASIKIFEGEILMDESFKYEPIPFATFVAFHELGHNYYYTEKYCDMFATNEMLKRGYNPSQCYYSNYYCLSDAQKERKKFQFDYLEKIKYKIRKR